MLSTISSPGRTVRAAAPFASSCEEERFKRRGCTDWGGCGCEKDWPWGSVGFPRFSTEILSKAKSDWGHPDVEGTLSTWHFQASFAKPPADEYGGLNRWLRGTSNGAQEPAHAHEPGGYGGLGYSRLLPRDHEVVPEFKAPKWTHTMSAVPGGFEWLQAHGPLGGLPTLDFPEYSMFGRCPWGGYGANPIPASIQADWDSHGHLITGGMPYQEGIYLDMNQVVRQGLYWSGKPTNETLRSYARFEFGWEAADAVTEAVAILEPTYAMIGSDQSQRALDLLRSAMPSMTDVAKRSWRWRILYLRAVIDALAYNGTSMFKNGTVHGSNTTAGPLKAAFGELDRIYHVERDCCHPGGPADCTDSVDTQANCTILALRPGLSTLAAEVECSDRRVKHELQRLGTSASGVPLFSWRYLPGFGLETSRRYAGTTAQSLLELGRHDAVVPNACGAGLHGVDYSRLDVAFVPVADPSGELVVFRPQ